MISTHRQRHEARAQGGYVLMLVLASLIMIAIIAGRLATRVDAERDMTVVFRAEALAELETDDALASLLYWFMSQRLTANGTGDGQAFQWVADGRWYELSPTVRVSVQDTRGLISVNQPESPLLRRLLESRGVQADRAARMIDILADYIDTDNLKRLNGAEAPEYRAAGLPPPRNDHLRSLQELAQLLVWRDDPALLAGLMPVLSTRVAGLLNPNTAPRAVMEALLPGASAQQLDLFATLKESAPFLTGEIASAATGLPLANDEFMFHVSNEFRVIVWVVGRPRAREYNLLLEPGGVNAPWLIRSSQEVARPNISKTSRPPFESPLSALKPPVFKR